MNTVSTASTAENKSKENQNKSKENQPSVVNALEEVARWRDVEEGRIDRKVLEIDDEEFRVQDAIEELNRQLANLGFLRDELEVEKDEIPREAERRMHEAIVAGLAMDAELLKQRSEAYGQALVDREEEIAERMAQPGIAEKVGAFEEFEEIQEAALEAIPALYRPALLDQHEQFREELTSIFDAMANDIAPVESFTSTVTLIGSEDVDSDRGKLEALAIALPIPYEVSKWKDWSEDLRSMIAYRVVAAVSAALSRVNAGNADVQYAPYPDKKGGFLAIQVWLGNCSVEGNLQEVLEEELREVCESAAEFQIGAIELELTWQVPDVVAPVGVEEV